MNRKVSSWSVLAVSLLLPLSGASAQKAKGKKQVVPLPGAVVYQLDPAASTIGWVGRKVSGSHHGTVKLKSGSVLVQGQSLAGGEFEVDMNRLAVDDLTDPGLNQKLVGHLKSDDFFSTEKFPTASFKIREVLPVASPAPNGPTHEVSGDLTIKGQTHPVKFPATIAIAADKGQATAKVMVDRTLYGIRYGSGKFFQNLGDKMISDEFELQLNLSANAQPR